jgi:hypothetical protein
MSGTNYNQKQAYVNVPMSIPDDYVLCNLCNRNYNESAYGKHLSHCERKSREATMKNKVKPGTTTGNNNNANTNSTYTHSNKPNLNVKFGKK